MYLQSVGNFFLRTPHLTSNYYTIVYNSILLHTRILYFQYGKLFPYYLLSNHKNITVGVLEQKIKFDSEICTGMYVWYSQIKYSMDLTREIFLTLEFFFLFFNHETCTYVCMYVCSVFCMITIFFHCMEHTTIRITNKLNILISKDSNGDLRLS